MNEMLRGLLIGFLVARERAVSPRTFARDRRVVHELLAMIEVAGEGADVADVVEIRPGASLAPGRRRFTLSEGLDIDVALDAARRVLDRPRPTRSDDDTRDQVATALRQLGRWLTRSGGYDALVFGVMLERTTYGFVEPPSIEQPRTLRLVR